MYDLDQLRDSACTRRGFLKRMTAAGLGVAAAGLLAGIGAPSIALGQSGASDVFPGIPGRTVDEQALNFALTLEILEADIYRQALNIASGFDRRTRLDSSGVRYGRAISPGTLSQSDARAAFQYVLQFALVEAAHRDFLDTAIRAGGGTPVTRAANGYNFAGRLPKTMSDILVALLPLEETGVRAYLGALPSISNLATAQVAGTIYSTEARHSAAIRYLLNQDTGPVKLRGDLEVAAADEGTFEYFLSPATVVQAASAYVRA